MGLALWGLAAGVMAAEEGGKPATPAAPATTPASGHPAPIGIGEPLSPLGKDWKPPLKGPSDAGEKAIAKFKFPDDLKIELWAAEPLLANPNALAVDEKGRVYVAETYRYHGGVLDIRGYLSGPKAMLEPDIASTTVEERVAFVRRVLGKEADKLAVDHDRIVLVQDTDGDGKGDKSTVFSDGYNRIEDGLGSGVMARKGDVYYTNIPALYLLRDQNNDGVADSNKVLSTGYGVRYAYLGHDLHGMVFGPDGKLYFSVGDRGANATAFDGSKAVNTESGAVFRCEPDGSNLELFATGLRNPQELRFDQYGNLFTGDNNPDKGDPARWVYICEGGDTGWRIGYQHGEKPRDGGPWMAEQIWQLKEFNNANYIVPPVAHLGAGPSGLEYNPGGAALPARYADTFFMCDFRGGSGNSGIWAVKNKPLGAGFDLVSLEGKPVDRGALTKNSLIHGILCVDLEFGPDGSAYIVDWTEGWARPMAGRVYKLFDPKLRGQGVVAETKKLIEEGFDQRPVEELTKLLAHADLRVRREAQYALAAKGEAATAALLPIAKKHDSVLPRLHAIWGLGQIARKANKPAMLAELLPLLADADLNVRCQTAQVIGDAKFAEAADYLRKLALDPEPRARYFAVQAMGKLKLTGDISTIFHVLRENADKDPWLRHGCVNALANLGDAQAIAEMGKDPSPSVRLGAVLALRRLNSHLLGGFLNDSDRIVVLEAARAINDNTVVWGMAALAELLDKPMNKTKGFAEKPQGPTPGWTGDPAEWVLWRALNANYRLGTPEAAERVAKFAARSDVPAPLRVEALRGLGDWDKPLNRDRITNLWRPIPPRDGKPARDAAAKVVEEIAKNSPNDVRIAATNLMRKLGLGEPGFLVATVADLKAAPEVRIAALQSLDAADSAAATAKLNDALKIALADKSEALRAEGIKIRTAQEGGVEEAEKYLAKGTTREKQAALIGLGVTGDKKADAILAAWLDKLIAGQVPTELKLELMEAAGKRQTPEIEAKIRAFKDARDTNDPMTEHLDVLAGGDIAAGRQIFRERADVSCIRCHTAEREGGIVGPVLDGLASKQPREYLVEAIVLPNAKIAEGFETLVVKTKSGQFRTGILKEETATELVLLNPDDQANPLIRVPKADIESRDRGPSAMPEGLHRALSKRELRDLIEYLASLK